MNPLDAIRSLIGGQQKQQLISPLAHNPKQAFDIAHQVEAFNPNANKFTFPQLVDLAGKYGNQIAPKVNINGQSDQPAQQPQQPTIPSNLENIPNDPGAVYNSLIAHAAKQYGIPAPLLKGVLAHETMQFMPKYVGGYHTDGTGRGIAAIDKNAHPEISDQQAFDPSFAIPWAAKTLTGYENQEGNWVNALRRYNGGGNYAANVPGYAGVPVSQRTMDYANNVMKQAKHFASASDNTANKPSTP